MKKILPLTLLALAPGLCPTASALNPIIQTIYTADPAPVVKDGVCYVFTSHDEDVSVNNFFTMKDWRCFSSTDMVNWTDHGKVASLHDFKWAGSGWGGGFENGAWAPQAIERDGKWYLYVPLQGRGIGVLVADGPFGPYTDPLGKPLIAGDHIDPTVLIDDDGQAYLSWGNPKNWYAKLNRDMISLDTSIGDKGLVAQDMTVEQFGPRSKPDEKRPTSYEEGPWLYKRAGLYYLFYAGGPISEHLAYSTSKSAVGPWNYGGVVMPTQGGSFTNHPGVVDFKGRTYLFYHNADLPGGGGFKRSVCVEELTFNADGSVIKVDMTKDGAAPVATLDPYKQVEAETSAWASGVETARADDGGMIVTDIGDGAYLRVSNVDFGQRAPREFLARVSAGKSGGVLAVRLGGPAGQKIAELRVTAPSDAPAWQTLSAPVGPVSGIHDVYFTFEPPAGTGFAFDHWRFQ